MSSNPMKSGTTRASGVEKPSQLVDKRVPQHKAFAAGSRNQQSQLVHKTQDTFSTYNMPSIKASRPNKSPDCKK